jgi:two-component system, OmpR family, response regulator
MSDDHASSASRTALLVEDDPDVRARIKSLLESQTALKVVGEADSADMAMAALANAPASVVVVDLVLAQGTGFDVIRQCQALPSRPECIVLLTNYCTEDIRRKALELGADHAFDKSLELEALVNALTAPV